jgi:hypothetical protein
MGFRTETHNSQVVGTLEHRPYLIGKVEVAEVIDCHGHLNSILVQGELREGRDSSIVHEDVHLAVLPFNLFCKYVD